jgi:hypothetical protein
MKASIEFIARIAGVTMAATAVWSLGCEQLIGLDGPYVAETGGGGAPGECEEGATEECYSGDQAIRGIGACQPGTRTCSKGAWGACAGEGVPSIEKCAGNDDDCNGEAICTGALGWALSFGGAGNDSSLAITSDSSANVIVAGSFSNTVAFGGETFKSIGGTDVVIFKLDPAGNLIWSKAYGSAETDGARAVAVDSAGNIVVVGVLGDPIDFGGGPLTSNKASLFVAKLDPNGTHLWSKSFTGASTLNAVDAAIDASGNVVISTSLSGSINFGAGLQTAQAESLAIFKLDGGGQLIWSRLFGSSLCCGTLRSTIAVDIAGNVGIAGSFQGTIAFGPTMLTSTKRDLFLAKLSPLGESSWVVQGQAMDHSAVEGLAFDTTGALVVSGTFPSPALTFGSNTITGYSSTDAFVAKFDSSGAFAWGKAFGMGGVDETGSEVEIDAANNISFTGTSSSSTLDFGMGPVGPAGMFVVKLDSTGKAIWARTTDMAMTPYPDAAIAVDKEGYTLLTRSFLNGMTFGGVNLTSAGMSDIFVIKLGP